MTYIYVYQTENGYICGLWALSRTVVFTVPKGVKLVPTDFLTALQVVKGKVVAFGTVGVSHVWHCTLQSHLDAQLLVEANLNKNLFF